MSRLSPLFNREKFRRRTMPALAAAVVAASAGAAALLAAPAHASTNPYQRGPDPTAASITAPQGPFAVAEQKVPQGTAPGFRDATIYYPTDTSQGTFGAVAIMPGFLAPQAAVAWYGPRIASQGFVVMTLDSDTYFDYPTARSNQLLAALTYLTTQSPIRDRVDTSRLAVAGWSMGGGGTLEATAKQPTLKAAVAFAPWDLTGAGKVAAPTLIFGAQNDVNAPVNVFALPLYNSLNRAPAKEFIELRNANHLAFAAPNTTVAEYTIAWLKRYVDNDTRYDQFLCPAPTADQSILTAQATCPAH